MWVARAYNNIGPTVMTSTSIDAVESYSLIYDHFRRSRNSERPKRQSCRNKIDSRSPRKNLIEDIVSGKM